MRWILAGLLAAALTASAFAADVDLVRVWPQWRTPESFDRIREYFGHKESEGRDIIVRTQPNDRAGLYFLVRVKSAAPLSGAKFVLEVIHPKVPDPKTYTFPVSLPAKGGAVELGLTGSDWAEGRSAHPVAWKITLFDGSGQNVASQHSFLWEKPAQ